MKDICRDREEISVEDLRANFEGRLILRSLNLSFERGRVYGILGPNGAGKSTFIRILAKVLENYSGKIVFLGKDLRELSLGDLSKLRGYLAQRETVLNDLTVIEAVLFGRIPHSGIVKNGSDLELVGELLEKLDLGHLASRRLSEISGGELQKVLLARALAQRPQVLLLDEPINHLDPKNQVEILNFLQKETRHQRLITLLVLHDVNLALRFCDSLTILKGGKIYFSGPPEKIQEGILREVYDINVKILSDESRKVVVFYP